MTTSSFSSSRSRRIACAASTLIVIVLPAVLLALVMGAGVPESWWPQTGQAFAADQPHAESAHQDPCDLIVGPATDYCERGQHSTSSVGKAPMRAPVRHGCWFRPRRDWRPSPCGGAGALPDTGGAECGAQSPARSARPV